MSELVLTYTDENGKERRATVDAERFIVGRHSESDLCIPDGRLSRRHLAIERFGDILVASDAGSSNGTLLNGNPLENPVGLNNGDVLDLGGVQIHVKKASYNSSDDFDVPERDETPDIPESEEPVVVPGSGISVASQPQTAKNSNSWMLLMLIPVFGLIVVVFAVGVIYLLSGENNKTIAKKQDDPVYSSDDDGDNDIEKPSNKSDGGNTSSQTGPLSNNSSSDTPSNSNTSGPTVKLSDTAKIEQNGGAFLRRIAQNDPRAFLTSEQAQRVSSRVKQLSGSSALADNLNSARKNASQIKSLAQSKNLKPQFLAIAAVAKLGGSRGDVVQTAQGMADVLDKLSVHLGNEFGEDALLIIAAYGQGAAGDTMKLRNMLQELANKFPESTRAIRTIWFLQKNGKISQSEFDSALNFLAIGTISQNPKEFGVNAEALTL
jgi:pSer/pThr/pTyr-binding forkhead associated (FHA) protein